MSDDSGGRELSGGAPIARRRPLPSQFGRIGVEAEADLAAALVYERRKPIGELRQGISRP